MNQMQRCITPAMRDVLLEHIDGLPVPVSIRMPARVRMVGSAIAHGFLRKEKVARDAVFPSRATAPVTIITDRGRAVLARAIAEWTDAAIRAEHCKDELMISALLDARENPRPKFGRPRVPDRPADAPGAPERVPEKSAV